MVIGRTARYVSREQALDYVCGYTIINDVSARDFQFITTQWAAGKVPDTLAPVGPYIADRTEIPDPHVLELKTWVNGALMQDGNTRRLHLRRPLPRELPLRADDALARRPDRHGTPARRRLRAEAARCSSLPGDVVPVEITGLGTLENPVKDA